MAQAILFFFGGFETVSTTLSLAAHQLAEYPEVQEKLIEEIDQKLKETNGVITYDILMKEMPYLNMVLDGNLHIYICRLKMIISYAYGKYDCL